MSASTITIGGVAAQPRVETGSAAPRREYNLALGYLRAFLVVLVVAHHSVLAYHPLVPAKLTPMLEQPHLWGGFPVVDAHRTVLAAVFAGFNDNFFMSLMFFVSGLFVWSSLRRKGTETFVTDRMIRLAIPFMVAAAVVAPIAYFPTYLQRGTDSSLIGYWHTWRSLGYWPAGPAWFVWVLLLFDLLAAGLTTIVRGWGDSLGHLTSSAREHPARFFWLLLAISAAAYIPMAILFDPGYWTQVGPFAFQTARILHYAAYFVAGIAVGAYGIERGLVASDGVLARHWLRWCLAAFGAFLIGVVFVLSLAALIKSVALPAIELMGGVTFVLCCATASFAYLALFVRFATTRRGWFDSLASNEYGIYLIHYPFVTWLQYVLLGAMLPALVKGSLVFAGALLASWTVAATLRRIPAVARAV